ncbi:retrovirus-related Pol polyprotein from transposon opus [Trichonephila clavipes]|nr:retrovirus-related Pol polyprotein from transposon opus [Trichonephila clavipes]
MCGSLTGQRYVDDILRPHVGPFLNGLPWAIFEQDNARPNTAKVAQDSYVIFRLFHGRSVPPICPCRALYLQVDDHVHPGNCPAAVSSEKKQDLHTEICYHLPSWDMNEQMSYFSSFSDEWSRDLKSVQVLKQLSCRAERLETEQRQNLEQQEQLSIEILRLEMELSRIANQSANQNNGQTSRVKSLDEIVKMVRLLTVKVPNKSDGWEYFFSSLEKAFASEMVSDELKPKVLLCMLGDKVSNLLVNLGEEELKDYESLKQVVLKEYEPLPQKYV